MMSLVAALLGTKGGARGQVQRGGRTQDGARSRGCGDGRTWRGGRSAPQNPGCLGQDGWIRSQEDYRVGLKSRRK